MESRPKDPSKARNKNVLVIGGSGSGKTRFFIKPNLLQMHSSYVITDPKSELCVFKTVINPQKTEASCCCFANKICEDIVWVIV